MIELSEAHEYKVDGVKYPGVTEIISHFGFSDFSKVPDHILQPAIDFGNVVHEVVRLTELNDTANFNDDHKKIKKHWEDFKNSININNSIIDIKTFKKPKYSNIIQIFGYKILIEHADVLFWRSKQFIEQPIYSPNWGFCGKPDYFNTGKAGIKKLHILTIPDLSGFDAKKNVFTYDATKDKKWEDEFKYLLKVYQIQKREGAI